jgi:hypothetical protein
MERAHLTHPLTRPQSTGCAHGDGGAADLVTAIAECLALHADCVEKFGTETPEEHARVPAELRQKMCQARANVSATLEGSSVEQHVLHIQNLCRGLRLVVMKRLTSC